MKPFAATITGLASSVIIGLATFTVSANELNNFQRQHLTQVWNTCVSDVQIGLTNDTEEDCKLKVREARDRLVHTEAKFQKKMAERNAEVAKQRQAEAEEKMREEIKRTNHLANVYENIYTNAAEAKEYPGAERSSSWGTTKLVVGDFEISKKKNRVAANGEVQYAMNFAELNKTMDVGTIINSASTYMAVDGIVYDSTDGIIQGDSDSVRNLMNIFKQSPTLNSIVVVKNNEKIGVITRADYTWLMTK